jgi:FAD/FMN-containing dehydrogenase
MSSARPAARISGWGRYPVATTALATARSVEAARLETAAGRGIVARGAGRAYGDAAIGTERTLDVTALDRMRAFDTATGLLTAEAGVRLADIVAVFLPRGFFPPVLPGTKYATLGGAIAADVHGKNHHRDGGFGEHVESLLLATPAGELLQLSRNTEPELFRATIGGMGLTGTIVEATLRLSRIETGWIRRRTIPARDLTAALASLEATADSHYSVAWIDTLARGSNLGRSLVFLGEHAQSADLAGRQPFAATAARPLTVPFDFPAITLNRWSVGAFNAAYFHSGAGASGEEKLVPVDAYFFPLDRLGGWNRIYGKSGFVQHQSVIPLQTAPAALAEILSRIARRGDASFLSVLKRLGSGAGLLSFPLPGYTLALDFPMRPGLLEFLEELDQIVVRAGGRLYLAKDSRQSRATFEAGYDGLAQFRAIRQAIDPDGRVSSHLSRRLGI